MLEKLDTDDAIVFVRFEFVCDDIAGDDAQVLETFGGGDGVDVLLLGARVGEGGDA